MRSFTVPLSEADVKSLKAGDMLLLSGEIWTCRSGFYRKFLEEGCPFPLDAANHNVMLHSGPIVRILEDGGYEVKAISITTSIRFNHWEPETIKRLGLKAIIGKGKVGRETKAALQESGCLYLSRTGTFAGAFSLKVKRVKEVHWLDLGLPEALWVFDFADLGPLVVETDSYGNSLYEQVAEQVGLTVQEQYERLGITGYEYAEK